MMRAASTNRNAIIERSYEPDEGVCARAIESLLKNEAAGPRQAGRLEDEKGVSKNDSLARPQYTQT